MQPVKMPWWPKLVAFRPSGHPKWDQNLWSTPLNKTEHPRLILVLPPYQSQLSFWGTKLNSTFRSSYWEPLFEVNFSENSAKTIRLFTLDFYEVIKLMRSKASSTITFILSPLSRAHNVISSYIYMYIYIQIAALTIL